MKGTASRCLPVAECIGVLVGALAWDWLADGRASILRALALSLSCGAALALARYIKYRWPPKVPKSPRQD